MQNSLRTLQQVGTKMNSIGKSMSTYITLPLIAAGASAIKFASDYNESVNKVETAFGPASTAVKEFAKTSLTQFGLAEGSALDAAAQFGDMATSMGIVPVAAAKMSTSLVGLAADLASFKNISIDQANTALAGIFSGETESLKKLGIVMTEANLQSFALSKGIKVQVKDMDQASKVNLRYAFILANTTNAQGDFARTGGGAANQMRIFQESLKQLAQQFGAVILPAFTKVIVFVNGIIKGFSDLDPVTKGVIIGIAGVAAAVGPLLVGLGNIIGIIPRLVVQFTALKAVILANPYTAAAVGILAVAAGVYAFVQANKQAVTTQDTLNAAVAKGNENAVSEIGVLDKLYATATNVKLSTNERKKAVDDLQAVYPAYFKNIKDEAILNGQATTSYVALREAIFNKSRASAIDNELQNRSNERIKTEGKLRQDIEATENEIARLRKGANEIVLQEANSIEKTKRVTISKSDAIAAQNKLLDIQKDKLTRYYNYNLGQDKALLDAKTDYMSKTGKLEENEAAKLADIKLGTDAITAVNKKMVKAGTIEFYEGQISSLQKLQKEQATTNTEWINYQNNINAIQKKIDALSSTKINLPRPQVDSADPVAPPVITLNLDDYDRQIQRYKELQGQFSNDTDAGKAAFQRYEELINNTQLKIDEVKGVKENSELLKKFADDAEKEKIRIESIMTSFNDSISSAMASAAASFAVGVGAAIGNSLSEGGNLLTGIGKLLFSTLGDLLIRLGTIAIESGITIKAIQASLETLNPYIAIGAGIAAIALGAAIKSSINGAGAFANGGMVGGTSYSGDKLFARVNSGEMILNQKQQGNLSRMINPAVTAGDVAVNIMGALDIDGSKLKLLLKRVDERDNRLG